MEGGSSLTCFSVLNSNLFAGSDDGGVLLSTNNGTNWIAAGLTNTSVFALAVIGTNLFAGTWGDGIFLTTDNGTSWTAVNNGLMGTYFKCLAVAGTNLFAGTDAEGVFLSTNNGTSWTAVNNGLTNALVSSLTVTGTNLFVGTYGGGVFLSTNNGTSWTAVNNGLTNTNNWCLVANATDLFAGTWGDGMWKRPLSEMITSIEPTVTDLPTRSALEQNYPNPFNPSTTIRYGLPTRSHMTLAVFNELGQQVATLVRGEQEAGYHEVKFNASRLPSGVYLYRLQAGNHMEVRRALLMK
jgi:hypothetical protein